MRTWTRFTGITNAIFFILEIFSVSFTIFFYYTVKFMVS